MVASAAVLLVNILELVQEVSNAPLLHLQILDHVLDLLHLLLESAHLGVVHLLLEVHGLEQALILALRRLNLRRFLGEFLLELLDALGVVPYGPLGGELDAELGRLPLQLPALGPLLLQLVLVELQPGLELPLLPVEIFDLASEFFLVALGDVELVDGGLDVDHALAPLFLQQEALLLELVLQLPPVGLQLVLHQLVHLELGQLELPLLLLLSNLELGLLALELYVELLLELRLVLLELPLPALLQLLLLGLHLALQAEPELAELHLQLLGQLLLVALDLLLLGRGSGTLKLLPQVLEFALVLSLLLLLHLLELPSRLLSDQHFLPLEALLHVPAQLVHHFLVLCLDLALLGLEALDVSLLGVERPPLLLAEFFNFEVEAFLLGFLDGLADASVGLDQRRLLTLQLVLEVGLQAPQLSLCLLLHLQALLLFLLPQLLPEEGELAVHLQIALDTQLALLLPLVQLPFLLFRSDFLVLSLQDLLRH